jgi:acetylornithine deacetylase/succinyl-diaminopimelate desuccinylase-like protein
VALIATIGSERSALAELTRALVAAPSQNPPGDESRVAAVVREALGGLDGVRLSTPSLHPARPNLVFSAGRRDRRSLVFAAHADTVPVRGDWSVDPFEGLADGSRVYGLGASDNKGAIAAMTLAFQTLVQEGIGEHGRLILVVNADEEGGGAVGIDVVAQHLRDHEDPDAAVVAEPSGIHEGFEQLYVAARGASRFLVSVEGTPTHSSLSSNDGVGNAIESLIRVSAGLGDRLELTSIADDRYGWKAELVPVVSEGGEGWGVIPGWASMSFDLRVAPGVEQERAEADIRAAVEAAGREAGVEARLRYPDSGLRWVGASCVAADELVVRCARESWTEVFLGEPRLGGFPGGTDARVLGDLGIPVLPALGPGALIRAHAADEYVETGELVAAYRLYLGIAIRFLQSDTGET